MSDPGLTLIGLTVVLESVTLPGFTETLFCISDAFIGFAPKFLTVGFAVALCPISFEKTLDKLWSALKLLPPFDPAVFGP